MTDEYLLSLKKNGYVKIPQAFSKEVITNLKEKINLVAKNKAPLSQENVPYLNRGHHMLYNLQAEDPIFLRCILNNPKIRSILISELNDQWYKQIPQEDCNFILRAIAARSGGPEPLPLHIDSFVPSVGPFSFSIQVAIILEDQNIENGCTTVVPGSHLKGTYAGQSELKNAVPILSSAGDAVIWDSRLWHGTNGNISGSSRWSVVSTFVRWWVKQNYNLTRSLPNSIYLQLTNEEKAVMGYCSIPPLDEYERIDIKAGYDALKANVADYFK